MKRDLCQHCGTRLIGPHIRCPKCSAITTNYKAGVLGAFDKLERAEQNQRHTRVTELRFKTKRAL